MMLVSNFEMLPVCPPDGSRCTPQYNGDVMGLPFSWHSSLSGSHIQGTLCRDNCLGIWVAWIRCFQREPWLDFMLFFSKWEKKKLILIQTLTIWLSKKESRICGIYGGHSRYWPLVTVIDYLSCPCMGKGRLKEERVSFGSQFEGAVYLGGWSRGVRSSRQLLKLHLQSGNTARQTLVLMLCSPFCLLKTPVYRVESPTVGMSLPTSANPV